MNKAIKRIINKDLKSIEHYKLNDQGIFIEFNEENMLEAHALICGPKGSLYEGGYLFFNITFPKNYPFSPPDVSYLSRGRVRIHPNLYVKSHKSGFGKVCLSILGTWSGPSWTTVMDISTVLLSIQSLLDNEPLLNEPGFSKSNKHQLSLINNYNDVIFFENVYSLLIKNYKDIPENFLVFKDIIIKDLNINYINIYNNILKYKNIKNKRITISFYEINFDINYEELLNIYKNFCNELELVI